MVAQKIQLLPGIGKLSFHGFGSGGNRWGLQSVGSVSEEVGFFALNVLSGFVSGRTIPLLPGDWGASGCRVDLVVARVYLVSRWYVPDRWTGTGVLSE